MEEQTKPIFKFFAATWILIFWSAFFYFTWKPLIIPALILFSSYGATYLRRNLVYGRNYIRSITSGLIWGVTLGFGLYYLNNLFSAPFLWRLGCYLFGLLVAGYIGYRDKVETEILQHTKLEAYYVTAQLSSIISYCLSLLLLHFFKS